MHPDALFFYNPARHESQPPESLPGGHDEVANQATRCFRGIVEAVVARGRAANPELEDASVGGRSLASATEKSCRFRHQ
ncbi:MAG TPA: hypothetical protein DFS52_12270 [Myxococcales bacterium]|nr:hypothetical protein [Myxococcales bacterium]